MAQFVQKTNKKWLVRIRLKGVNLSETFLTKGEARGWAGDIEGKIERGEITPATRLSSKTQEAPRAHTLGDAFARYSHEHSPDRDGQRWEQVRLKAFRTTVAADFPPDMLPDGPIAEWLEQGIATPQPDGGICLYLAQLPINQITTPLLARWRDTRMKASNRRGGTIAKATFARELNLVQTVLKTARTEWHWLKHDPLRDLKKPKKTPPRNRLFSDEEVEQLCAVLKYTGGIPTTRKQFIALAMLFAIETAMRRDEITSLTWDRIHFDRRVAHIPKSKNSDPRDVPLSNFALEYLRRVQSYPRPFMVDKDVLSNLFGRARNQCHIKNLHFHDARANAATRLAPYFRQNELALILGHRNSSSLDIYYREKPENLVDRLNDLNRARAAAITATPHTTPRKHSQAS